MGGTGIIWQVSRSLDRRVACDIWSTTINRYPYTVQSNRGGERGLDERVARCDGAYWELPCTRCSEEDLCGTEVGHGSVSYIYINLIENFVIKLIQ